MEHTNDLIEQYNYDEFTREKVFPFLNFENSPTLGQKGDDYTLLGLDQNETTLKTILSHQLYTVVEFGSFT